MELTTQWSTLRTEAVWSLNAHVSGWIGFITYFMLHGKSLPTLEEKLLFYTEVICLKSLNKNYKIHLTPTLARNKLATLLDNIQIASVISRDIVLIQLATIKIDT